MEESRMNQNTINADATEDVTDTMTEVSEQSNSKFSVDCSVQAGSPSLKMVRFKVVESVRSEQDRKHEHKLNLENQEYKVAPTRSNNNSRESLVVGGVAATIFLLCCLTIGVTTNISKDVENMHWENHSTMVQSFNTHSGTTSLNNTNHINRGDTDHL